MLGAIWPTKFWRGAENEETVKGRTKKPTRGIMLHVIVEDWRDQRGERRGSRRQSSAPLWGN